MIIRRQYEADVDDMIRELKSMMDQHEAQVRELAQLLKLPLKSRPKSVDDSLTMLAQG